MRNVTDAKLFGRQSKQDAQTRSISQHIKYAHNRFDIGFILFQTHARGSDFAGFKAVDETTRISIFYAHLNKYSNDRVTCQQERTRSFSLTYRPSAGHFDDYR